MRLPFWPTLIVAAAVAVMVGLGIWQLGRADEKKALVQRFEAAAKLPPTGWPSVPSADDSLLYRRADGFCLEVAGWRTIAGRNRADEPGWSHIASCRTGGLEGPGMRVDMGWSKSPKQPSGWKGGQVSGVIVPDRENRIRLVSANAAPGLQPSAPPSPATIPNSHLLYAVQWFFFAAAAAIIYLLALRSRRKKGDLPTGTPPPPT
jgi:cytochrome oxidase assembly protein ShyY1